MTKKQEQERAQTKVKECLLETIKPGDPVYCILRHVSRSGMLRAIDLYIIVNNQPVHIGLSAAVVMGHRFSRKHDGILVGGAGMDMGFALVSTLAYYLFGDEKQLTHHWL